MNVLHYSDSFAKEMELLYGRCDLMVVTGDLSKVDFGSLVDLKEKRPAFGVYGNHDSGNYFEELGITNLHNRTVEWEGMLWGGFQGCLKYKEGGISFTEDEAEDFADNFPAVDILLLHAGPFGLLDDSSDSVHVGSKAIRRYVEEKKPKFVFVGHQYTNADMIFETTKIYRTFGARLISVG